jgi:hypothetical protein
MPIAMTITVPEVIKRRGIFLRFMLLSPNKVSICEMNLPVDQYLPVMH